MNLIDENLLYKPDEQFHLNEVSFNFKKGNIYTILGRTLSGKTTLLKTIAGLLTPDKGTTKMAFGAPMTRLELLFMALARKMIQGA